MLFMPKVNILEKNTPVDIFIFQSCKNKHEKKNYV